MLGALLRMPLSMPSDVAHDDGPAAREVVPRHPVVDVHAERLFVDDRRRRERDRASCDRTTRSPCPMLKRLRSPLLRNATSTGSSAMPLGSGWSLKRTRTCLPWACERKPVMSGNEARVDAVAGGRAHAPVRVQHEDVEREALGPVRVDLGQGFGWPCTRSTSCAIRPERRGGSARSGPSAPDSRCAASCRLRSEGRRTRQARRCRGPSRCSPDQCPG